MRGLLAEDMFDHYTSVILCDDMLEGLIGKGYRRVEDVVGGGIGKCSGHDNIGLAGFVMGYLFDRRDQKVNKGLGGINMV